MNKVKTFWEKHKVEVIIIGAGIITATAAIIIGKKTMGKPLVIDDVLQNDWVDPYTEVLKSYGAIYEEGSSVPVATLDVAQKFLKERGDRYQLGIYDDLTSAIWIIKSE